MMNTSVNPLQSLEPEHLPQWFRLHSDAQAHEALRQWVKTARLTDMLDPRVPEPYRVFLCDLLLGNAQKRMQRVRRNFTLEVLEPIKVGRGLDDYGRREYELYEPAEYQMAPDEAIQVFIKFGPNGKGRSAGKVREVEPTPKAVKVSNGTAEVNTDTTTAKPKPTKKAKKASE